MAILYSYPRTLPKNEDLLIISRQPSNPSKTANYNVSVKELATYINPSGTPGTGKPNYVPIFQATASGNILTDSVLFQDAVTNPTSFSIGETIAPINTIITGDLTLGGNLNDTTGTTTLNVVNVNNVLTVANNTATPNLVGGGLTINGGITLNGDVKLGTGPFYDSNNAAGVAEQVLVSQANGTLNWENYQGSGLEFQAAWNALTDDPDLTAITLDSSQTGKYWVVSIAGATDLSGITDWQAGDWAIISEDALGTIFWDKIDNSSTLTGSGNINKIAKWDSQNSLGDSRIGDDGTTITMPGANMSSVLMMLDDQQLQLGTGNDMRIYHDSANNENLFNNTSGKLIIKQGQDGGDIAFENDNAYGDTTEYFRIDGGSQQNIFSQQITAIDGSGEIPSYSFNSDPSTGIYRRASGDIGFRADSLSLTPTSTSSDRHISLGAVSTDIQINIGDGRVSPYNTGSLIIEGVDKTTISQSLIASGSTLDIAYAINATAGAGGNLTLTSSDGTALTLSKERELQLNHYGVGTITGTSTYSLQVDALGNVIEGALNPGVFTGADGTNAGTTGIVPAPAATDNIKFLRGDATWATVSTANDFLTGLAFNTTDGVLTATVSNQSDVTVDLDGRYLTEVPVATTADLGGIKIGYTPVAGAQDYAVELNSDEKAYVSVPWVNTVYTAGDGINFSGTPATQINADINYISYSGNNNFIVNGTQNSEGTTIPTGSQIIYADPSGTKIVNRGLVSDLPFLPLGGGTMEGNINMDSYDISEIDELSFGYSAKITGGPGNINIDTGNLNVTGGNLTVSGASQSSFGGQVTIPVTPNAATDAASKSYVLSQVGGLGTFQGGYDATNNPGSPALTGASNIAVGTGDFYTVTTAGAITFSDSPTGDATLEVGDFIFASTDITASSSPASTDYTLVLADQNIAGAGTTDANTAKGIAGFNSAHFSVSPTGWVQGNFLPLTGGTLTGALGIIGSTPEITIYDGSPNNFKYLNIIQSGSTASFLTQGGSNTQGQFTFRQTNGTTFTNSLIINQQFNATFIGTITASNFSGSSSGTNTGDQTNITGNAGTATTFSTGRTNYKGVTDGAVAGQMMWKHYGNNHTIFDASNSTSPQGTSVNNTNSNSPWTATYPTLMGWNGSSSYGVRVDSARVADTAASSSGNASTATALQTARTINAVSFNGTADIKVPSIYDGNYRRVTNPGGAEYVTQASAVTGAIEIVIGNNSGGMFTFTIEVYEYSTNRSFTLKVGGHLSGVTWYNEFAYLVGNPGSSLNYTIRFGRNSAGKFVVYVGELSKTWSYPQVFVTDICWGFNANSLTTTTGWAINFRTGSFEGVTRTLSNVDNHATAASVGNSVVKRDAAGSFSAGVIDGTRLRSSGTVSGLDVVAGNNLSCDNQIVLNSFTCINAEGAGSGTAIDPIQNIPASGIPSGGSESDTTTDLGVMDNGKVVRTTQEAVIYFSAAQINALSTATGGGLTLIDPPGTGKFVVIEKITWLIGYSPDSCMNNNQRYEICQESGLTSGSAAADIVGYITGTNINNITCNGNADLYSYGIYEHDSGRATLNRIYRPNTEVYMRKYHPTYSISSSVNEVRIKIRYRVWDVVTF